MVRLLARLERTGDAGAAQSLSGISDEVLRGLPERVTDRLARQAHVLAQYDA